MYTLGPFSLDETELDINPGGSNNLSSQPVIGVLLQNASTTYITVSSSNITDVIAPASPFLIKYDKPTANPPTIRVLPMIPQSNNIYVTVYQLGDSPQIPSVVAAPSSLAAPASLLLNPLPASTTVNAGAGGSAPKTIPYANTITLGADSQGALYATACSVQFYVYQTGNGTATTLNYIVYTSSGFTLLSCNQTNISTSSGSPTQLIDSKTAEKIPIYSGDDIYLGLQTSYSAGSSTITLLNDTNDPSFVKISF